MDGRGWEVPSKCWESLPECRESLPECWESLPECRVSLPKCREGLGGLPAGPGGVRRPSQMVRRGHEAHSDGWGFGSPPKRAGRRRESLLVSLEGVGMPEGAGRGWETLSEGWVGSVRPPREPGGVGRPF